MNRQSFSLGDKVRLNDRVGVTGKVVGFNTMGDSYLVKWDDPKLTPSIQSVPARRLVLNKWFVDNMLKCECGSASVPGFEGLHSVWCPKWEPRMKKD